MIISDPDRQKDPDPYSDPDPQHGHYSHRLGYTETISLNWVKEGEAITTNEDVRANTCTTREQRTVKVQGCQEIFKNLHGAWIIFWRASEVFM
jgi:hypothetical protein